MDTVNRFLRFARAIRISDSELIGADPERFMKAANRLTQRAEVNVTTDVYFTKKGIENINQADAATAAAAYLRVSSKIRKKFLDFDFTSKHARTEEALRLIHAYRSYIGIKNILRVMGRLHVVPSLREDYNALTGRNLETDAKLVEEAERFGHAVVKLTDIKSHLEVSRLFLSLGKIKGFDYMQTIAALADLAGPEETLVNDLRLSSGGISIRNAKQGAIESLRDVIAATLYRLAQV